jgi:hypothetical protein
MCDNRRAHFQTRVVARQYYAFVFGHVKGSYTLRSVEGTGCPALVDRLVLRGGAGSQCELTAQVAIALMFLIGSPYISKVPHE